MECRPAIVFEPSVLNLYSSLVETSRELSTVSNQSDLVQQLNSTVLPLLHDVVVSLSCKILFSSALNNFGAGNHAHFDLSGTSCA